MLLLHLPKLIVIIYLGMDKVPFSRLSMMHDEVLVLDGACGTELLRLGYDIDVRLYLYSYHVIHT